jgi:hypothetical protein
MGSGDRGFGVESWPVTDYSQAKAMLISRVKTRCNSHALI